MNDVYVRYEVLCLWELNTKTTFYLAIEGNRIYVVLLLLLLLFPSYFDSICST